MDQCEHKDFIVDANVVRLEDTKRFMAEIKVKCVTCQTPFRFVGLPAGVDLNSPTVNVTGEECLLPIAPKGEVFSVIDGAMSGFTVRKVK